MHGCIYMARPRVTIVLGAQALEPLNSILYTNTLIVQADLGFFLIGFDLLLDWSTTTFEEDMFVFLLECNPKT